MFLLLFLFKVWSFFIIMEEKYQFKDYFNKLLYCANLLKYNIVQNELFHDLSDIKCKYRLPTASEKRLFRGFTLQYRRQIFH